MPDFRFLPQLTIQGIFRLKDGAQTEINEFETQLEELKVGSI